MSQNWVEPAGGQLYAEDLCSPHGRRDVRSLLPDSAWTVALIELYHTRMPRCTRAAPPTKTDIRRRQLLSHVVEKRLLFDRRDDGHQRLVLRLRGGELCGDLCRVGRDEV